jgi:hypothetical protein
MADEIDRWESEGGALEQSPTELALDELGSSTSPPAAAASQKLSADAERRASSQTSSSIADSERGQRGSTAR